MALIDELEFCHCSLNRNLNEIVRAVEGAGDATVLGCGEVPSGRRTQAQQYAAALEAWADVTPPAADVESEYQTVSTLLGEANRVKLELVRHLVRRLRDNAYVLYPEQDEDFETTESRIQHLEICCFNWEQNLSILMDEIGRGERTIGWHGTGLFCACGDTDASNTYPSMLRTRLDSITSKDDGLLMQLLTKLDEAYA